MAIVDQMRHELQLAGRELAEYEKVHSELMANAYAATVKALSNAISARDAYMGRHAERVAAYGLAIAKHAEPDLVRDPQVEFGFLLHDIGKLAVPDTVLKKQGPLNPREWRLIRKHPQIGYKILQEIEFLDRARCVVLYHHERWDGRGYPERLSGEEIPLAARVFAVADTLDALTSDRPYRRGVGFDEAFEEVDRSVGSQFCPTIVEAMHQVPRETFESIRTEKA